MKKISIVALVLSLFVVLISVNQSEARKETKAKFAVFQFKSTTHDFGKIAQGKPVTVEFKFKNVGTVPLVISNAQGSCGCTTPDWTKEAVAPGKEGFVKATYNAASMGTFNKTVTLTANTEKGQEVLTIKGEVIKAENAN